MLVLEDTLGISTGHDELRALIKQFVDDAENQG